MKKEVKTIKLNIKMAKKMKIYKENIKNRRFRFIFSKIFLIFGETDLKKIAKIEINLIKNLNESFFVSTFKKMKWKANWESFGKFMFLIYKTSNYKYDLKNKKKNVFIEDPIKGNESKRNHYTKWLDSLDFSKNSTNKKVRRVLKLVFNEN